MGNGHSAIDKLIALTTLKKYQEGGEVVGEPDGGGLKKWLETNVSKEQIVPMLEFITGATERGPSEQASALDLAMAMPVIGSLSKPAKALRGLKSLFSKGKKAQKLKSGVKFPSAMVKVAESGQPERLVTAVEMYDDAGRKLIQPFYKSSGTSGGTRNIRAGKWMPFLGRLDEPIFTYPKGWYVKGRRSLAKGGEKVLHGAVPKFAKSMSPEMQDYWLRMGSKRMQDASNVLSRMERKKMLPTLKQFRDIGGRQHYAGDLEGAYHGAFQGWSRPGRYAAGNFAPQEGVEVIARDSEKVNRLLSDIFKVNPQRRLYQDGGQVLQIPQKKELDIVWPVDGESPEDMEQAKYNPVTELLLEALFEKLKRQQGQQRKPGKRLDPEAIKLYTIAQPDVV